MQKSGVEENIQQDSFNWSQITTVLLPRGFHMRPLVVLVDFTNEVNSLCQKYLGQELDVYLSKGINELANTRSIVALVSLGISYYDNVEIIISPKVDDSRFTSSSNRTMINQVISKILRSYLLLLAADQESRLHDIKKSCLELIQKELKKLAKTLV